MASISERDYNWLVAQLQHQQRAIEALEAEKRELERRLSELRRGIGISVCIQGHTMSLTSPVATVVSQSTEPPDPEITGIFPVMPDPTREEAGWPPLNTPRVPPVRPVTRVSRPPRSNASPVEPPQFGTLANITGHHPSARRPDTERRYPQGHNPYSDSYVLG
jgi:hypothetical protein